VEGGDYRMLESALSPPSCVIPPAYDMRLTLIVPGLVARSPATLADTPALARFARVADGGNVVLGGLAHAIVAAAGMPPATPAAPLLALGAGLDPQGDYVLAADPVTLVAGRDDVVLAGRVDDLAPADAAALIAALDAHFATDRLAFAAPRAATWFARTSSSPRLATTPIDVALHRPIFPHLPAGPDGKTWQRWQNEIQMLLFECPVNAAREARGAAPVTGLWFWGGGRRAEVPATAGAVFLADPGAAGDLVRGLALHAGHDPALPATFDAALTRARGAGALLLALPALADDAGIAATGERWIAPAVDALARGNVATLDLLADGNGMTVRWVARRPPALARLAARWRGPRFTLPDAAA